MKINKTLTALSDPTRREILDLLKKSDMSAGAIGKNFKITAPSLSHHLSALREAGLVVSERNGQEIIYSLNVSDFEEIAETLLNFFKKSKK